MLICNKTNRTAVVRLRFCRLRLKGKQGRSQSPEVVEESIQLDDGPDLVQRAREALALECSNWNERDWYGWKYWLKD